MHLAVFLDELPPAVTVFAFIATRNDLPGCWSEYIQESGLVFLLHGTKKRGARFFGRSEGLLPWLLSTNKIKAAADKDREYDHPN